MSSSRLWFVLIFISLFLCLLGFFTSNSENKYANFSRDDIYRLIVSEFTKKNNSSRDLTLTSFPQFQIDRTLLDPEFALPHYHKYSSDLMLEFHQQEEKCLKTAQVLSSKLLERLPKKLQLWLQGICKTGIQLEETFLQTYPFMHPNGRSFAKLLNELSAKDSGTTSKYFHVLEISSANLTSDLLSEILTNKNIFLDKGSLVVKVSEKENEPAASHYKFFRQTDFEEFVKGQGFELKTSNEEVSNFISGYQLEFRSETQAKARYGSFLFLIGLIVFTSLLILGFARLLFLRRLEQEKRNFSYQLLAHELRTPVAALKIQMDCLLDSYEIIPKSLQGTTVKMGSNLDRLVQVVKVSDSYIKNKTQTSFLNFSAEKILSLNEFMEKLSEDFPIEVVFYPPNSDLSFVLDPYWLNFCISNLISNGLKHGESPVSVSWRNEGNSLVFEISDSGQSLRSDPRYSFKKSESGGLGIGLQMVDRIVREMGGVLEFNPSPSKWTLKLYKVLK